MTQAVKPLIQNLMGGSDVNCNTFSGRLPDNAGVEVANMGACIFFVYSGDDCNDDLEIGAYDAGDEDLCGA